MRRTKNPADSGASTPAGMASGKRVRVPYAALLGVAVTLAVAGFALGRFAVSGPDRWSLRAAESTLSAPVAVASTATSVTGDAGMVEVPVLVGMRADEAAVVLETAGFRVRLLDVGEPVAAASKRLVVSQQPTSGAVLGASSVVTISAPPFTQETSASTATTAGRPARVGVVCIDPGHQAHSDTKLEPIGPGAKTQRPRATGGSTGVATGIPEHEIALQISMNLKKRLESSGVKVVMTRTTNDVRLSNSQRAKIANRVKADLFVRVHCGVSTDPTDAGVSAFYPVKNRWTGGIVSTSRAAADKIERAMARTTGATSQGVKRQAGIAGFNWSKVPSVFVETGYLSNPTEDRLMASPKYQDKLAEGIAQGVRGFLAEERP